MKFSKHVQIQPSATMAMNERAAEKKRAGEYIYNLTVGEAELATDERIKESAKTALDRGETHYVSAAGLTELREACSHWYNKQFKTDFTKDQVIVTCGGKAALQMLCHAFVEEADEVIIIAPFWVSYFSMVELFGGVPKIIQTEYEKHWKVDPDMLEQSLTEKTKFIFLNNGSNPTGVLYTREELQKILEIAHKYNILVVSDEVYSGLTYDGATYVSCAEFEQYKDNVIIVQSASKNFAMTGWRVGFVLSNEKITETLKTIQSHSSSGTSSISQWAAVEALEHYKDISHSIRNALQKRRDIFVETFNKLFLKKIQKPNCAFYCFIPLSAFGVKDTDSLTFCMRVLEEGNIAMVPGSAFGKEGFVRCSFGSSEEKIVKALEVLHSYLQIDAIK